jgi:N-acetylneuraminic acid mutarotase
MFVTCCILTLKPNVMKWTLFFTSTILIILISACSENPPVASFTTDSDTYNTGDTIYFQSTCENATSFDWDFDDGTGSSEEHPSHVYTEEGKFTVELMASNEDGSDIARKSLTIEKIYPCWTELASFTDMRYGHISVAYNNLVYIIAGAKKVEAYNPATDEWSLKTNAPGWGSSYSSNCILDDQVYIISGEYDSTVQVYDLKTDSWSEGTPLIHVRGDGSAVSCNGKIYVVGGYRWWPIEFFYETVVIYDPETDTWTEKQCPYQGWAPATAVVNGKIYVFGGYYGLSNGVALSTVYEYDPVLDQWEQKTSMPTGRWGAACAVVNEHIYVIGGGLDFSFDNSYANDSNTVEVYDPSSDTWDTGSPIPVERQSGAACVLDGMIYVSGGAYTTSGAENNFHVYDPACDSNQ